MKLDFAWMGATSNCMIQLNKCNNDFYESITKSLKKKLFL